MSTSADIEVLSAAAQIVRAFGEHDRDAYFAGFADDASFIFHTTEQRLDTRAAYEALWRTWETDDAFHVHSCVSTNGRAQVFGSVAVFTHDVETTLELGGETSVVHERETIVFERRDGDSTGRADSRWLAVHEHLSPRP